MPEEELPFVSVLVPVRNESAFIRSLIAALAKQDYPRDRFEVIVADGLSTDDTRDRLAQMQQNWPQLRVIDNPSHIVSTGLNAAFAASCGDIVIRIDGHALPSSGFIRENVALLEEHPEAWIVGGPIRNSARTQFGKAVAVAMSHPLGVGNAFHRYQDYEGYSDSTAFPAIRRWVFDRIGLFDVRLVRNQDDEFNYRVTRAGGKIWVSPRIRYAYFVRERARQLLRQYFQYGFWRIPVLEKHGRPTTLRQLAPTAFYASCLTGVIAGAISGQPLVAAALPAAYAAALIGAGAGKLRSAGAAVALRVPLAIATMHAGYAVGVGYGVWARMFRPDAWDIDGQMSRISR